MSAGRAKSPPLRAPCALAIVDIDLASKTPRYHPAWMG